MPCGHVDPIFRRTPDTGGWRSLGVTVSKSRCHIVLLAHQSFQHTHCEAWGTLTARLGAQCGVSIIHGPPTHGISLAQYSCQVAVTAFHPSCCRSQTDSTSCIVKG